MVLDTDISAATDLLMLEKIRAQNYREEVASLKQFRADQMAMLRDEYANLASVQPELTLRQRVGLSIADKYMTTGTATTPAAVLADAVNDAARLKAAIDEVLKVL